MVDDDGVSMAEDKAMETSTPAVVRGEYSKEIVVEFDIEGGGRRRWYVGSRAQWTAQGA